MTAQRRRLAADPDAESLDADNSVPELAQGYRIWTAWPHFLNRHHGFRRGDDGKDEANEPYGIALVVSGAPRANGLARGVEEAYLPSSVFTDSHSSVNCLR